MTVTLNWPYLNIRSAHRRIMLDICELFENPTWCSKDIERTRNTVTQCLTLNYDIALQPTLVKHTHCTLTHHNWHVCRVIWKFHKWFKRYIADTKKCHKIISLELWPWPWTDFNESVIKFIWFKSACNWT